MPTSPFRKDGFREERIIPGYVEPAMSVEATDSPSTLHRHFAYRLHSFLAALEEWTPLAAYKARG